MLVRAKKNLFVHVVFVVVVVVVGNIKQRHRGFEVCQKKMVAWLNTRNERKKNGLNELNG